MSVQTEAERLRADVDALAERLAKLEAREETACGRCGLTCVLCNDKVKVMSFEQLAAKVGPLPTTVLASAEQGPKRSCPVFPLLTCDEEGRCVYECQRKNRLASAEGRPVCADWCGTMVDACRYGRRPHACFGANDFNGCGRLEPCYCTEPCYKSCRPLNPAPKPESAWLPLGQHPGGACESWCWPPPHTPYSHECTAYCRDRARATKPREAAQDSTTTEQEGRNSPPAVVGGADPLPAGFKVVGRSGLVVALPSDSTWVRYRGVPDEPVMQWGARPKSSLSTSMWFDGLYDILEPLPAEQPAPMVVMLPGFPHKFAQFVSDNQPAVRTGDALRARLGWGPLGEEQEQANLRANLDQRPPAPSEPATAALTPGSAQRVPLSERLRAWAGLYSARHEALPFAKEVADLEARLATVEKERDDAKAQATRVALAGKEAVGDTMVAAERERCLAWVVSWGVNYRWKECLDAIASGAPAPGATKETP